MDRDHTTVNDGEATPRARCQRPLRPEAKSEPIVVGRITTDLPALSVNVRERAWTAGGIVTQLVTHPLGRVTAPEAVGPPRRYLG